MTLVNENIVRIADESGIQFDEYRLAWAKHRHNEDGLDLEDFAISLIKECADIALREDHDPYECILKHFGVEE